MDVTKAPPTPDLSNLGVGTAASSASSSPGSAAAGASIAANVSTAVAAAADRVDIQPLDVAAALQILIAEVRAELTDIASPANTPPLLQTAELVAADLVKAEMPAAVLPPAPPVADVVTGPLPSTQPPGPALLEPQALPFVRLSNPEQSAPLAAPIPAEAPMQEPLTEAPDLAALLLGSDTRVGAGPGANVGVDLAPLPAGGPLPRVAPSVIPPDLDLGPLAPLFMPPGARLSSPAQASPVLVRLFLQAVPEDAGNPARWSATVTQLESTLQSALDRAVSAVEQWRNVPQVVVDVARETRSVVMSQLSDEPPGPLWLRPEWMWLSPHMERFRRRRRLARRGLADPDSWSLREDDIRQEAPARPHDEP
jgi:hypothetical protein